MSLHKDHISISVVEFGQMLHYLFTGGQNNITEFRGKQE